MDFLKLTNECLNVNDIYSQVVGKSTGAVSLFVGTTRDHFEKEKVIQLEYEAYIPMAEKEMSKICQQIREKWKVENIAIYHRLGVVPVSEASVVIAISSEHRGDSLDAVHYGIDHLKESVPIWKKEIYDRGVGEWKANIESSWINSESRKIPGSFTNTKKSDVPTEYIQIKASKDELDHRIHSFMKRKRRESDMTNIQEFCHRMPTIEPENSCARTESILVCRKDSKSHLKVSRVVNAYGPQTQNEPAVRTASTSQEPSRAAPDLPSGIEERLLNMEEHLGLHNNKTIPKDIYFRLKQLEDRILYLESVSPEYFNEEVLYNRKNDEVILNNIETRIAELRRKLKVK